MSTSTVSTSTAPRLTPSSAGAARRAGTLLVAAFAAFVVAVAAMVTLLADYDEALTEAAAASGVPVADVPAGVVAAVLRDVGGLWAHLVVFGLIAVSLALFVAGVRAATRVSPDGGHLARAAVVAAAAAPVAWLGVFALEMGISADDPSAWLGPYDALYAPLIAASSVAGSLAVLATVVLLRRVGVARRTGLVVLVLCVLVVVVAPLVGAPPILPLLLGAVVGIVMIRTARQVV